MKTLEITIRNETGLHARPAKVLVMLAKQFKSEISIQHGEKRANAKSMVSVLTLGAAKGSVIRVQVNGEDEELALGELEKAILSGLGDEVGAEEKALGLAPRTPTSLTPALSLAAKNAAQERESNESLAAKSAAQEREEEKSLTPTSLTPTLSLRARESNVIQGVGAAPGIAIGPVFHYKRNEVTVDASTRLSGDGRAHLEKALASAKAQLEELHQQMAAKKLGAEAAIFEAHVELLEDPELAAEVEAKLDSGQNIVPAWNEVIEEQARVIAALKDATLAARADDLRDVGRRVLRLMLGIEEGAVQMPETPVVVLAEDLSPSETAAFDTERVLGFGIVSGGPTSHIAILARALGLPAIVGADEALLGVAEQTQVILNGHDGSLTVAPSAEAVRQAQQTKADWLESRQRARQKANEPAVTLDGRHVDVSANAGSVADAQKAAKLGADGIGLLRTEFLFLERSTGPSEAEQYEVYRGVVEAMNGLPVILRTLDIGGDKPLPYIQLKAELNPFLGERGIRLCLNRPELFKEQLRAALRAAAHGTLQFMFPMVSDIQEIRQARALIEELRAELGSAPVKIGIMVEVPSAALMADILAPEVDFFSIGTNDLTQYTLAIDRGHPALAAKHDGMHPAVLRLIAQTVAAAHKYGKRADICGELGSDPQAIPVLVGLGMDELSVSIPAIPEVKAQVRGLKMAEVQELAQQVLGCASAREARDLVKRHFG